MNKGLFICHSRSAPGHWQNSGQF